jgi:alanine racemase
MKQVPPGTPVSYNGRYTTSRATVIATVPLGYADGFARALGNGRGSVLINGTRFPIAGSVTMDYLMVDVGPAPSCKVNDEVVAIGSQGRESISPDDIALLTGTIGYEILTGLDTSVDRCYFLDGKVAVIEKGVIF